jgi:proliferating cell nuclear antigen
MVIATIDATALQTVVEAVGVLVDECRVRVTSDGMRFRAADPALVAMVDVTLDASCFEHYECTETVLGLDLDRLAAVLGVAERGDSVDLSLDATTRTLHVGVGTLSYTLGLLDPDSIRDEPDLPDLDPPAEVTLSGAHIDRGVTAAAMVSDHLRLAVDEERETVSLQADGDTDDVVVELGDNDLQSFSPGPADSLYSLEYLKAITRVMPSDAAVTLELGEEFLAGIHFDLPDADQTVSYRVAPRIQHA